MSRAAIIGLKVVAAAVGACVGVCLLWGAMYGLVTVGGFSVRFMHVVWTWAAISSVLVVVTFLVLVVRVPGRRPGLAGFAAGQTVAIISGLLSGSVLGSLVIPSPRLPMSVPEALFCGVTWEIYGVRQVNVDIPYDLIVVAQVLAGAISYGAALARRRLPRNVCRKCGYLLVGLTVPRCPECGTAFSPSLISVWSHKVQ